MLRQDPNDLSLEVSCLSLLHYKNVTYPEWPMLYTTYISDCIGIGYRHTPSQRFGLYHSVSEHVVKAEQLTDDLLNEYIESVDETFLIQHQINASFLIRALHEFIEPIEEAPLIEVFLHVNEERSFLEENNKEADADFTNIKLIFDAVLSVYKKGHDSVERFHVLRGRETFILPAQGDANLHLRTYPRERQEELAKWVALHIEYLLNQKTEKKASYFERQLRGLIRLSKENKQDWIATCAAMREAVRDFKRAQAQPDIFSCLFSPGKKEVDPREQTSCEALVFLEEHARIYDLVSKKDIKSSIIVLVPLVPRLKFTSRDKRLLLFAPHLAF